jgi:hypothetical protein
VCDRLASCGTWDVLARESRSVFGAKTDAVGEHRCIVSQQRDRNANQHIYWQWASDWWDSQLAIAFLQAGTNETRRHETVRRRLHRDVVLTALRVVVTSKACRLSTAGEMIGLCRYAHSAQAPAPVPAGVTFKSR